MYSTLSVDCSSWRWNCKLFRIGSQPLNASVHAYSNVVKPDLGSDWSLRAQLQFLFPK